jgi:putative hydrolase of HD superfamily
MPEPSAAPNLEDKALAQPTPEEKAVVPLCFELAQLKLTRRSGWHHIGADPESVAEHSHRAAALAYFLAVHENHPKPELVVTMVVFHDMHEARTGDCSASAGNEHSKASITYNPHGHSINV